MTAPASPVPPEAQDGVPRPRRRTSTMNLIQSLGVVLGVVALLVLVVPRPTSVPRPAVDLAAAAAVAQPDLPFAPAVVVPQGWTVTSADVRRDTDGLATWTVNYLTEQRRYVGLMQAGGWTRGWQTSLTQGGTPQGEVDLGGSAWQVLVKPEKEITTLMRREPALTTLVLAKGGGVDDARMLAQGLPPAP